jgi:hypothetical protein
MPLLKLPPTASAIFDQHRDFLRENSELPVYSLPGIAQPKDIEDLCQAATESFLAGEGEGEDPAITFLAPAPATRLSPGSTVQEILDAHVEFFSTRPSAADGDDDHLNPQPAKPETHFFPFAFIVLEDANWHTNGVTVVFCHDDENFDDDDFTDDEDNPDSGDSWRVDECEVSLQALAGVCRDLVCDREEWTLIENEVGRPTRRTGNRRYLAERDEAWSAESISSEMARWSSSH